MLEGTDAITNEILEPITFVVVYPTVLPKKAGNLSVVVSVRCKRKQNEGQCIEVMKRSV